MAAADLTGTYVANCEITHLLQSEFRVAVSILDQHANSTPKTRNNTQKIHEKPQSTSTMTEPVSTSAAQFNLEAESFAEESQPDPTSNLAVELSMLNKAHKRNPNQHKNNVAEPNTNEEDGDATMG